MHKSTGAGEEGQVRSMWQGRSAETGTESHLYAQPQNWVQADKQAFRKMHWMQV